MYKKSIAPIEFVTHVQTLEDQSDLWPEGLELFNLPRNLAKWAVLTEMIDWLERAFLLHGPHTPDFNATLRNCSKTGLILLEALEKRGSREVVPASAFRWGKTIAAATKVALQAASNYLVFTACFPGWHKDLAAVDIIDRKSVV